MSDPLEPLLYSSQLYRKLNRYDYLYARTTYFQAQRPFSLPVPVV